MSGKDVGVGISTITGGVIGLGIGRGMVGRRIEVSRWYLRRPRTGKFIRDSIIVAFTIAGAALGTTVGEKAFGSSSTGVSAKV